MQRGRWSAVMSCGELSLRRCVQALSCDRCCWEGSRGGYQSKVWMRQKVVEQEAKGDSLAGRSLSLCRDGGRRMRMEGWSSLDSRNQEVCQDGAACSLSLHAGLKPLRFSRLLVFCCHESLLSTNPFFFLSNLLVGDRPGVGGQKSTLSDSYVEQKSENWQFSHVPRICDRAFIG